VAEIARIADRAREARCHVGRSDLIDTELAGLVDVDQKAVVEYDTRRTRIDIDDIRLGGAGYRRGERKQRGAEAARQQPPGKIHATAHRGCRLPNARRPPGWRRPARLDARDCTERIALFARVYAS